MGATRQINYNLISQAYDACFEQVGHTRVIEIGSLFADISIEVSDVHSAIYREIKDET
jgi:hypothetical protein